MIKSFTRNGARFDLQKSLNEERNGRRNGLKYTRSTINMDIARIIGISSPRHGRVEVLGLQASSPTLSIQPLPIPNGSLRRIMAYKIGRRDMTVSAALQFFTKTFNPIHST